MSSRSQLMSTADPAPGPAFPAGVISRLETPRMVPLFAVIAMLPAPFWLAAFGAELLYYFTGHSARMALAAQEFEYVQLALAVVAVGAGFAGIARMRAGNRAFRDAVLQLGANFFGLSLALVDLTLLRTVAERGPSVHWINLVLTGVAAPIYGVAVYLGWSLLFRDDYPAVRVAPEPGRRNLMFANARPEPPSSREASPWTSTGSDTSA